MALAKHASVLRDAMLPYHFGYHLISSLGPSGVSTHGRALFNFQLF